MFICEICGKNLRSLFLNFDFLKTQTPWFYFFQLFPWNDSNNNVPIWSQVQLDQNKTWKWGLSKLVLGIHFYWFYLHTYWCLYTQKTLRLNKQNHYWHVLVMIFYTLCSLSHLGDIGKKVIFKFTLKFKFCRMKNVIKTEYYIQKCLGPLISNHK